MDTVCHTPYLAWPSHAATSHACARASRTIISRRLWTSYWRPGCANPLEVPRDSSACPYRHSCKPGHGFPQFRGRSGTTFSINFVPVVMEPVRTCLPSRARRARATAWQSTASDDRLLTAWIPADLKRQSLSHRSHRSTGTRRSDQEGSRYVPTCMTRITAYEPALVRARRHRISLPAGLDAASAQERESRPPRSNYARPAESQGADILQTLGDLHRNVRNKTNRDLVP